MNLLWIEILALKLGLFGFALFMFDEFLLFPFIFLF